MSILTCQDLAFSYDGKTIISDLNFSINEGDYLCIVGKNGAGKSTLMKGLLGQKKCSKGKILFEKGMKQKEIGYLPQQTAAQKDFPASVFEVVISGRLNSCGLRPFYSKTDRKVAYENMERLDLMMLKNKCYRTLSGGQQQRVLLARALCATHKMLLLDEPVTGLDPVMKNELYSSIQNLNQQNITIIMISHDINSVMEYATHILHVGKEQTFFGTKEEYIECEIGKNFIKGGQEDD